MFLLICPIESNSISVLRTKMKTFLKSWLFYEVRLANISSKKISLRTDRLLEKLSNGCDQTMLLMLFGKWSGGPGAPSAASS